MDAILHPREGRRQFTLDETLLLANDVCDSTNVEYVAHAMCSYVSLLDDSPLTCVDGPKPWGTYVRFIKELTHRPIRDSVRLYAVLADRIMTGPTLTGGGDSRGEFIEEMIDTPVFKEYHRWWLGGAPELLRYVLTFLRFLKKMKYVDEEFNAIAFRKWLSTEEKLAQLSYGEDPYLDLLRRVVVYLCGNLEVNIADGRFGPGSVSEQGIVGPMRKATALALDRRLQRLTLDSTVTSAAGPTSSLKDALHNMRLARELRTEDSSSFAYSRLMFVPKDTSTARSICMEPNSYMFVQQMILRGVERALETNPIGNYVTLRDQTRNQQGAWYGSVTGALDTIDLSSASDTVHVDLVRRLFPKRWLYYLLGSRISRVKLTDGTYRKVEKFAPMGSALCFPTQCIIFTSVVITSMLEWLAGRQLITLPPQPMHLTDGQLSSWLSLYVHRGYAVSNAYTPNVLEEPTVYGDDILCDARVTEDVMRRLSQLGFVVNVAKSFTGAQSVRESCGKYYWDGSDITPYLYKPQHSIEGMTPTRYASLVDHANYAWDYGYFNLRSSIIKTLCDSEYLSIRLDRKVGLKCIQGVRDILPFVTNRNNFGIFTLRRTSYGPVRTNSGLQLTEEYTLRVRTRLQRRHSSDPFGRYEAYAYYRDAQSRRQREKIGESQHARRRPEDTRFALGWTPVRV